MHEPQSPKCTEIQARRVDIEVQKREVHERVQGVLVSTCNREGSGTAHSRALSYVPSRASHTRTLF